LVASVALGLWLACLQQVRRYSGFGFTRYFRRLCTKLLASVYSRDMTSTQQPLALIYTRVSTGRQVTDGHSLGEQERQLVEEATRRGYAVEIVREEGKSASKVSNRPALTDALNRLDRREAAALFALDLDRLSRSVSDFARMLDRANRRGWTLVVIGLGGVDTSTPEGQLVAHTLAAAAQYERAMVSKRVKRQHEARRARGIVWGVDEGNRPELPEAVRTRIAEAVAGGQSLRNIAADLNAQGVPTARGGLWHASTVRHVAASVARVAA